MTQPRTNHRRCRSPTQPGDAGVVPRVEEGQASGAQENPDLLVFGFRAWIGRITGHEQQVNRTGHAVQGVQGATCPHGWLVARDG